MTGTTAGDTAPYPGPPPVTAPDDVPLHRTTRGPAPRDAVGDVQADRCCEPVAITPAEPGLSPPVHPEGGA